MVTTLHGPGVKVVSLVVYICAVYAPLHPVEMTLLDECSHSGVFYVNDEYYTTSSNLNGEQVHAYGMTKL